MRLYKSTWRPSPKLEAQEHLNGRTHYVDDATLRWHKSRVLNCDITRDGLLCWIITSDALDMDNTRRGFRYVVFDVFGNVVSRNDIEDAYKTSKAARKALSEWLANADAKALTLEALERVEKNTARDLSDLRKVLV